MDASELELFSAGVRELATRHSGAALDAALAELGWADALEADRPVAVSVLFEAQGTAASSSGALDRVLARALGAGAEDAPARVVLPPLGSVAPPGARTEGGSPSGGAVSVRGLLTGMPAGGGPVLLAVTGAASAGTGPGAAGPGGEVALLSVEAGRLDARPVGGLDPRWGLVEVTAELDAPPEGDVVGAAVWADAVAQGQLALAHELVGTSQAMLDLAREHARERIQFGRPIARFQAVRHRLADALVATESARSALAVAWEEPTAANVAVAKAIAGRGSRLVAKHCQQVLAGIGFTAEHRFHLHLRRARVLDGLLGDSRSLARGIGQQLLEAGALPPMLPLRQK